VEHKDSTLTFQYRNLPEELRPKTLTKAAEIIAKYKYRCSEADLSLEAKPAVDWDKGEICFVDFFNFCSILKCV
jgi:trehalose-6-phosphatase